jgi:hypothetical protein
VKQFSQRAQRLRSVRKVCPDRRKEPKPVFSLLNGFAMVPANQQFGLYGLFEYAGHS